VELSDKPTEEGEQSNIPGKQGEHYDKSKELGD
jgi:hypothetical protein